MSSEKRLLEPGQSQGLARELLRAGSEIPLSTERKDRLWQSIALALPPAGGSPPPDHATPAAPPTTPPTTGALAGSQAGALSLGAKAAVSLGVGLLWVGAWFAGSALPGMLSPPSPAVVTQPPGQDAPGAHAAAQAAQARPEAPDTTPPAPTAAPAARATGATAASDPGSPGGRGATSAGGAVGGASNHGASIQETTTPPALPGAEDPSGAGSLPAAPTASAEAPASAAEIARQERINQLHEEAEMTRAARSALRGGDAAGALRLLEQLRLKFGGRGQLHQEREALAIEALGRSGQREQARARAEAFLRAYPTSPHAPDVQVFARLSRVVAVSARPVIFF